MIIKTIEDKIKFYNSILKNDVNAFVLCNNGNEKTPLFIMKNPSSETGFFELTCVLFKYTFTKGNLQEEKFMQEQGYVIIDNYAYDIQTPFSSFEIDKYMGNFEKISKKDCVLLLKEN